MLKKYFPIFSLLAGIVCGHPSAQALDTLVEAKAAYFHPTDERFRRIYSGGGIYGAEVTCQAWRELYAWGSADYFHKSGKSLGEHNSTRITLVPLALGLKYFYPVECCNVCADLYFGAGVTATYMHLKDNSPFVIRKTSKWGAGGIAKLGAIFHVYENFFVDLFANYYYTRISPHHNKDHRVVRHQANVSAWIFGVGIGYRFGCGCY